MAIEELKIRWICNQCGAVHERSDVLNMVLSKSGFTPVKIKEEPREQPRFERKEYQKPAEKTKPQIKPAEYIDDEEEEEIEDLRID